MELIPIAISLPQSHWDRQFDSGYWNFLLEASANVQYIARTIMTEYEDKKPTMLDVGCGNGVVPKLLKEGSFEFDYTGTDISKSALDTAR